MLQLHTILKMIHECSLLKYLKYLHICTCIRGISIYYYGPYRINEVIRLLQ